MSFEPITSVGINVPVRRVLVAMYVTHLPLKGYRLFTFGRRILEIDGLSSVS